MFENTLYRFPETSPNSFNHTVTYLQNSDFDADGKMTVNLGNKKVVVLVQSHQCGFCGPVKKVWQQIANEKFEVDNEILMCTIDAYENRNLLTRLVKITPKFKGFPYIFAYQNGLIETYNGDRQYDSIIFFCNKKLSPDI